MLRWCLALLILAAAMPAAAASPAAPVTAYVNGRWWTGEAFAPGARYVRGTVFVARPAGRPQRTVDLAGAYVVPPFADAHNHMPGTAAQVNDRAEAAGVFYLMNPTLLASAAPAMRRALVGPGKIDAVVSMGAITAPGGHPEALYVDILRPRVYPQIKPDAFLGDAFHYVTKASDIDPVLDRLVAQGAQFVKVMVLYSEEYERRRDDPAYRGYKGVNPALMPAIVAAAHKRGLRVAVHIETAADFRVIVAAGADEAAHMPGYYGSKGELSSFAIGEADAQAAARARIVVVPTASLALEANTDPARLAAVKAMQRASLLNLKRAGVPLLIGTDGQPDAAPDEARYLIGLGVLTPKEALVSLTRTTPQYILPGRRVGELKPGYEASFLALRENPVADFAAVKTIARRVKQGFEIPDPASRPTLAIAHVSVIAMRDAKVARDRTILIAGDRIVGVGANLPVPSGVRTIDGAGLYAIPGLWDMHVHVLDAAPGPEAKTVMAGMLRGGVVGVRDMGSTLPELQAWRAQAPSGGPLPELVAAGPVVNGPATPWSRPNEAHVADPKEADAVVARLADGGADFIKAYNGLSADSYAAVAAAAHRRGLTLAGHVPFAVDLDTVMAAGQRSVEHMEVSLSKSCGATAPAKAADLSLAALIKGGVDARSAVELDLRAGRDGPRCAALLRRVAARPIWWTPTLTLDFADRTFDDAEFRRFVQPDKAEACRTSGLPPAAGAPKVRREALAAELADVAMIRKAGVRLLAGTDMPSPCEAPVASLRRELGLLVRAGLTPYEALRTATVEPAAYLGRPSDGVLAPGARADIVLLAANPLADIAALSTVRQVIRAGVAVDAPAP